jgi:hypothetical protein
LDLWADVRASVLQTLPFDRSDPKIAQALADMPVPELVVRFYNWLGRLIHPHSRNIHRSQEFISSGTLKERSEDIEILLTKIANGTDLGPSLSKYIKIGYVYDSNMQNKNLNRRYDLDLLLNDWGIHHLHISQKICPDGFVKRDGPLLFAMFTEDDCYVLDIMKHGVWTNQHLVEVAVRNWPDAGLFIALQGVIGTQSSRAGYQYTAEDRKKLRGAGIATFIEVDRKFYMPRSGSISSAGNSSGTTMQAQKLLKGLKYVTEGLSNDPEFLKPHFDRLGVRHPSSRTFVPSLLTHLVRGDG